MIWLGSRDTDDETVVQFQHYPNGEVGIFDLGQRPHGPLEIGFVTWRFDNNGDILELILLKNHLDSIQYAEEYILKITYMPYSRLDRQDTPTTCFTLKYVADLINSLNFAYVIVLEPHSHVTTDLLSKSRARMVSPSLFKLAIETSLGKDWPDGSLVCFPDHGASLRYAGMLKDYESCVGEKHRDFSDGKITGLTIPKPDGWRYQPGARCIIVDDLCSRGGTFIQAGNILRNQFGFERVDLVVTHLEANVHTGDIFKNDSPIDRIYTSDAMDPRPHYGHRNISIFEL